MNNLSQDSLILSSSNSSGSLEEHDEDDGDEWGTAAALLDGLCAAVRAPDGRPDLVVTSAAAAAPWAWTLRCTDLHTVWERVLDAAGTGARPALRAARVAAAFRGGRVAVAATDAAVAVLALPGTAGLCLHAVTAPERAVHALVADLARRAGEAAVLRGQRDAARRERDAARQALAQGCCTVPASVPVAVPRCAGAVLGRARVCPRGVRRARPGGARIVADAGADDSDDVDGPL